MNEINQALRAAQQNLAELQEQVTFLSDAISTSNAGGVPILYLIITFVLACFIGYYVIWSVTPALHSPLMGVTNAISSVIIVGAIFAAGADGFTTSSVFGLAAVFLTGINIFGGFIVTQRMLSMFAKPKSPSKSTGAKSTGAKATKKGSRS